MEENNNITVVNATENNLKNVSLSIPKKKLTIVTGISGSGKSSLIFDTIAAESRRELNETFPSFVQRYLPKYSRPHVDLITNLPVTIIVDQKKLGDNARSTVGTYTDIYTFLRLLFSRVGEPFIGYSDVFSFNHPNGKCPQCGGLGVYKQLQIQKLVDFNKSLNEGPINFPSFQPNAWRWKRYAHSELFDTDKKLKDYSKEEIDLLLYSPIIKLKNPPANWPLSAKYEGVIPRIERSILGTDEGKRLASRVNEVVEEDLCPVCHGTRVNERVRSCKINGKSIADVTLLPLNEVLTFIEQIHHPLAKEIKIELHNRLSALLNIGLGYITLSRGTGTLSGGEAQRVKIARHINSALTDLLYVLDEPSAGLHPHDIMRLRKSLDHLRSRGNTVIMVEHHPDLIRTAEHIIDLGPRAGEEGGEIMYQGTLQGLLETNTITAQSLREKQTIKQQTRQPSAWMELGNSSFHNLKNIEIKLPLGVLTVLCGVAGSGKSSLMEVMKQRIQQPVVAISQKNIGISLRSTPATYMDISDAIRKLFSAANNVSTSYFSFNSKGACPECKGKGVIVTDMAFMEDIVTACEKCCGTRYSPETLRYLYNGKNIGQIMEMTVKTATRFFKDQPFVDLLKHLEEVGLGYLHLNQSLSTLSGGELQRLKLASHLDEKGTIYLLDEPVTGLHMEDIKTLLHLFNRLVDKGNTVIIAEHTLSVIRQADWLIEIGPEGGMNGGKIIFSGTPTDMAASKKSITAKYL